MSEKAQLLFKILKTQKQIIKQRIRKTRKALLQSEEFLRLQHDGTAVSFQLKQLRKRLRDKILRLNTLLHKVQVDWRSTYQKLRFLHPSKIVYEQCLGLAFINNVQNELQFVMNNIKPTAPYYVFVFVLRIAKDATYEVTKMSPVIDSWQEDLVRLNEAPDDLHTFVRNIRKRFQQAVLRGRL